MYIVYIYALRILRRIRQFPLTHEPIFSSLNSFPWQWKRNEFTGLTIVRDRCGSLPTHNRTTSDGTAQVNLQNQSMPPPRTIPLAITGRPHSMYTNSFRHSPPVSANNTGNQAIPLSPSMRTFSKSCSESDGSSLSIDEPDGCSIADDNGSFQMKQYK